MADTLLATRLKRGMIIKLDGELFRIHDLMHVTPGNLRGFVRVKARNLRSQTMSEQKLRSEDVIERATLDEQPDAWLVERHRRELFPLLHRRAWFAEAHDFLLYDLVRDDGSVDEDVLAYSNGSGPTRSLVVYHLRFASTAGTIKASVAYARKSPSGAKRLVRRASGDG